MEMPPRLYLQRGKNGILRHRYFSIDYNRVHRLKRVNSSHYDNVVRVVRHRLKQIDGPVLQQQYNSSASAAYVRTNFDLQFFLSHYTLDLSFHPFLSIMFAKCCAMTCDFLIIHGYRNVNVEGSKRFFYSLKAFFN